MHSATARTLDCCVLLIFSSYIQHCLKWKWMNHIVYSDVTKHLPISISCIFDISNFVFMTFAFMTFVFMTFVFMTFAANPRFTALTWLLGKNPSVCQIVIWNFHWIPTDTLYLNFYDSICGGYNRTVVWGRLLLSILANLLEHRYRRNIDINSCRDTIEQNTNGLRSYLYSVPKHKQ